MNDILRRKRIQILDESMLQVSSAEYYVGRATATYRSRTYKLTIEEFEDGSAMFSLLDMLKPFGLSITCRGESVEAAFDMLNGALDARGQEKIRCAV